MPRRNPKKLRGPSFDPPASRLAERNDPNPATSSRGEEGESRGRVKRRTWSEMNAAERAATSAALKRGGK